MTTRSSNEMHGVGIIIVLLYVCQIVLCLTTGKAMAYDGLSCYFFSVSNEDHMLLALEKKVIKSIAILSIARKT